MRQVKCPTCGSPEVRYSEDLKAYQCMMCAHIFDNRQPDTIAKTLPKESFDEWALVELFGHQKIVGRVTETTLAGGAFIRVDVPAIAGEFPAPACTRFFNPSAVYSLNPVTEEVARSLLTQARFRNEPVSRYDLPQIAEKVNDAGEDNRYGGNDT